MNASPSSNEPANTQESEPTLRLRILDVFTGLAILTLALLVFAQSMGRYVLGVSLASIEELATLLLAIISFGGAAQAYRDKQHLSVTFIVEKLLGRYARIDFAFVRFLNLFFFGTLLIYTYRLFIRARATSFTFLPFSKAYLYLIFLFALLAMISFELSDIIRPVISRNASMPNRKGQLSDPPS